LYLLRRDPIGVVIGIAVLTFAFSGMAVNARNLLGASGLVSLVIGGLFGIHRSRRDAALLRMLRFPLVPLFALEYTLLALPFGLLLLFFAPFGFAFCFALLVFACAIAFVPQERVKSRQTASRQAAFRKTLAFAPRRFLPNITNLLPLTRTAIEWQSGLRLRGALMLVLTIGGLAISHEIWLLAIAAAFVVMQPVEFYGHSEPRILLQAMLTKRSPNGLLWLKIQQGVWLEMLVIVPFLTYWCVRYATSVLDVGIAFGVALLFAFILISIAVLSKYAFWKPSANQTFLVMLMVAWLFVLMWFPVLIPMPQILVFMVYRKARKNLNNLL
jgi:hypothetical protein